MFRKVKHRIFDYEPRFYKPDEDEQEKRKRKLGFRTAQRKVSRKKSPLMWVVMLMMILYIVAKWNGMF